MEPLLLEMHNWMTSYMKSFYTDDEDVMKGIRIKEIHTGYVTSNAREIAKHLHLEERDVQLAEIMGLFHDVGRFRQYTLYHTFNDSKSEDHADLGVRVLSELDFMQKLPAEDYALVCFAIKNHNKMYIEPAESKRELLFARLLRDADKLDIYRVLEPYLSKEHADEAPRFISPREGDFVSPDFVKDFVEGRQVDFYRMVTFYDRLVTRLMWAYDINFRWTMQKLVERGYLEKIISCLPDQPGLPEGIERLRRHVKAKCASTDLVDIY